MSNEILIASLSFIGTLVGSLGGILASSKLTNYRIEQLEKKVQEHNNVISRTQVLEEKIKVANHRLDALEKFKHEPLAL